MHAEDAYLFRHALMRDAAYQLQPFEERAALHGLALEAMELALAANLGPVAEELADHARLSAGARDKELHYLMVAAKHARDVYQPDREVQLCARVADVAGCPPAVAAEHLRSACNALMNLGRAAAAEPLADRAAALSRQAGDRLHELSAQRLKLDIYRVTGRRGLMNAALPQLLIELRQVGDRKSLSRAELDLAELHEHADADEAALDAIRRSLALAQECGDQRQEALVYSRLAFQLHRMGRTREGEAAAKSGLALCERNGDLYAETPLHNAMGVLCVESDRVDEAKRHYRRAMDISTATGRPYARAVMLRNLANAEYYFGGNLRVARDLYATARDFFAEAGDLEFCAGASRLLGSTELALGNRESALLAFAESVRCARLAGDVQAEAEARRQVVQTRMSNDAGWFNLAELVEIARLSAKSRSWENLAMTLGQAGRALQRFGLLNAASRVFELLNRLLDAPAMALRGTADEGWIHFQLLLGADVDIEPRLERLRRALSKQDTPHHYVATVLVPLIRRELGRAAGPIGLSANPARSANGDRARQTHLEIREMMAGPAAQYAHASEMAKACGLAWDELCKASSAGRPALLFRGYLPTDLTPACRAALLDRLRVMDARTHNELRQRNAALFGAMTGEPPDWTADDLPGREVSSLEAIVLPALG